MKEVGEGEKRKKNMNKSKNKKHKISAFSFGFMDVFSVCMDFTVGFITGEYPSRPYDYRW